MASLPSAPRSRITKRPSLSFYTPRISISLPLRGVSVSDTQGQICANSGSDTACAASASHSVRYVSLPEFPAPTSRSARKQKHRRQRSHCLARRLSRPQPWCYRREATIALPEMSIPARMRAARPRRDPPMTRPIFGLVDRVRTYQNGEAKIGTSIHGCTEEGSVEDMALFFRLRPAL